MNNIRETFWTDTSSLFSTSMDESRTAHMLAILTSTFVLISICGLFNFASDSWYFACLSINFVYLFSNNGSKYNQAFIFLYFVLFINVLVIDIPDFFKPQMRLGLFLLMTATTASLFESQNAVNFRRYIFKYMTLGFVVLSIGSFFAFFLGINMMHGLVDMSDYSSYSTNGGWFGGLTRHSMLLGPISMIASLFFFTLYLENKKRIYIALLFMCIMSAVMASSRAAILGVVAALLYSLLVLKIDVVMKQRVIALLIICGLATLPIYDIVFAGIINKEQKRKETTEVLDSRQAKFDYRIAEFKSSPLLGVGFCAIDINGDDQYSSNNGQIEPGTSHLAVLSMTGMLGMLAYLIILYQAYKNASGAYTPHSRFILLCFIAIFVHAWFEGYVFSAGGPLCFTYWLIIGAATDLKY